jgi:hypothetical protein
MFAAMTFNLYIPIPPYGSAVFDKYKSLPSKQVGGGHHGAILATMLGKVPLDEILGPKHKRKIAGQDPKSEQSADTLLRTICRHPCCRTLLGDRC